MGYALAAYLRNCNSSPLFPLGGDVEGQRCATANDVSYIVIVMYKQSNERLLKSVSGPPNPRGRIQDWLKLGLTKWQEISHEGANQQLQLDRRTFYHRFALFVTEIQSPPKFKLKNPLV